MMRFFPAILVSLLLVVSACNQNSKELESKINNLNKEVEALKSEAESVQSHIISLSMRISAVEPGTASVSTEENSYYIADTKFGPFIITANGVSEYLDGYKIKLGIANITSATFNGAKLKVSWGPQLDLKTMQYSEWKSQQREREFNLTEKFYPADYTDVEITLTPAKPEEIKTFELGIELNEISLKK